jgi:hypothetical protein
MTVQGVCAQDVAMWERELRAAGWTSTRRTVWRAPCGCLYRGPYGAWCKMVAIRANNLECPNHSP